MTHYVSEQGFWEAVVIAGVAGLFIGFFVGFLLGEETKGKGLRSLRREDGASAVEFALIVPLFFMLVFGIITFGIAFMQLQTARGAVREGARAGAVLPQLGTYKTPDQIKQATVDASSGLIKSLSDVVVTYKTPTGTVAAACTPGGQVVVSYATSHANANTGIVANLIFFQVPMNQVSSAQFMCEG